MDGKALYKHNAEVSIVTQGAPFRKGSRNFYLSWRWGWPLSALAPEARSIHWSCGPASLPEG